ncbi:hypothetical protein PIB30_059883 [Stylosanthes scabra]|uniref:Uncharacterized protein n=1 Tax=Stylosanthes scabra TaxID=79078 RepID=A0ABU6VJB9_9FABA|nr:hypothetical protein [Stylosanthes scabra]
MVIAEREMRILMAGFNAACKTIILCRLKLGVIVTTFLTIGGAAHLPPVFLTDRLLDAVIMASLIATASAAKIEPASILDDVPSISLPA